MSRNELILRSIAGFLALGGIYWGVLLLATFGVWALMPLPFGIGYVLTAGYLARTIRPPVAEDCCVIWVVSITVQGGWLLLSLGDDWKLPQFWWIGATAASVIGLWLETRVDDRRASLVRVTSSC